jgi:hypothetical protein
LLELMKAREESRLTLDDAVKSLLAEHEKNVRK